MQPSLHEHQICAKLRSILTSKPLHLNFFLPQLAWWTIYHSTSQRMKKSNPVGSQRWNYGNWSYININTNSHRAVLQFFQLSKLGEHFSFVNCVFKMIRLYLLQLFRLNSSLDLICIFRNYTHSWHKNLNRRLQKYFRTNNYVMWGLTASVLLLYLSVWANLTFGLRLSDLHAVMLVWF